MATTPVLCAYIPLTKGQVAIVDWADYDFLAQWKWHAADGRKGLWYVARRISLGNRTTYLYMHRVLLGLESDGKRVGDHINRNPLDNRRENLRIANYSQNAANSRLRRDSTTGFKGVCWDKSSGLYVATIMKDRRRIHLGSFQAAKEAAAAYRGAAELYHGEFRRIA
jgi:hypothetical protein